MSEPERHHDLRSIEAWAAACRRSHARSLERRIERQSHSWAWILPILAVVITLLILGLPR